MVSTFDIVLILFLLCSLLSAFFRTPSSPSLHPCLITALFSVCLSCLCPSCLLACIFSFFLVPTLLLLVAPQAVDTGRAGRGLFCSSQQHTLTSYHSPPAIPASSTETSWKCSEEIDRWSVGLWLSTTYSSTTQRCVAMSVITVP